jgi:hypothetical protein
MCIENPLLLAHIFADFFMSEETGTSEAAA